MTKRIKLTAEEFTELHFNQHKTLGEIAAMVGYHPDTLSRYVRNELHLSVVKHKKHIPENLHEKIIADYLECCVIRDVSQKYGISEQRISKLLKSRNIDIKAMKDINQSNKLKGVCKRTTESYASELIGRDIELIGEYKGIAIKHLHKCLVCGNEWEAPPNNILFSKSGCPICSLKRNAKSRSMDPREYDKRLAKLCPNLVALEDYVSYFTKITHMCLTCGHVFKKYPVCKPTSVGCKNCNPPSGVLGIVTTVNGIDFDSRFEAAMYVELLNYIDADDFQHKRWYKNARYCSDFYIKSMDLWIEVSNFNDAKYLNKIYTKRQLVENFVFFSDAKQIHLYFGEMENKNNVK
jgi:hypothetical protein